MLFVALVLYRNRLLLLKRTHNTSNDTWELPSIEIQQTKNYVNIQQKFKSQIGLDINPYLVVHSYQRIHLNNNITLYKCSLLSDPSALSINSDYSGYLWTYILGTSQLTFVPPHDDIIKFLLHDTYVISRKTKGQGSHKRGFASMDPAKKRMIQSLAGKRAHALGRAHRWTSEEASRAGRLGRGKPKSTKGHHDMSPASIRSQLLQLLQDSLSKRPGEPVSFQAIGKELGISRQYARTLYYQLKALHPVPPLGKRGAGTRNIRKRTLK